MDKKVPTATTDSQAEGGITEYLLIFVLVFTLVMLIIFLFAPAVGNIFSNAINNF